MDEAEGPRVSLGEHVKRRRLQLGLTQDEPAAKLNKKNRSYVGHIERNRANARRPSVAMLADLAAGLEESLSALLAQDHPGGDAGAAPDQRTAQPRPGVADRQHQDPLRSLKSRAGRAGLARAAGSFCRAPRSLSRPSTASGSLV